VPHNVTSLVAVVTPRTGKFIKNSLSVFEEEKTFYKIVYYTLYLNRQKSDEQIFVHLIALIASLF